MRTLRDETIVNELVRLAEEHDGKLLPEAVVEAARPETSPLHSQFEWDDSAASVAWRLHQARNLINVVVRYEKISDDKMITHRVFVSLTPDRQVDGGGYRLVTAVMSDASQRQQLLDDALDDLRRVQTKYADLKELADVFAAIDRLARHDALSATA